MCLRSAGSARGQQRRSAEITPGRPCAGAGAWGGSSAERFLAARPFSNNSPPKQNPPLSPPSQLARLTTNTFQGPAPAALAALPAGVSTPVFSELDADLAARLEKLDAKIAGAKTGVRFV